MSNAAIGAEPEDPKDRNFVTALARGLDVLRCFDPGEHDLTNADFAERTGLPKATVSRLTYTLCQLDYLVADPRRGTYRLGPGVLRLGFGVLAGMDVCDRAAQVLRDLRNGPNSYITASLAERHRQEAVYVAVLMSRENVSLALSIGSRLPLFRSAIGRAILVVMDPPERDEAFRAARREDPEGESARRASFDRAHAEFTDRGFCTGYGDWRDDVNAIAVPVLSLNGSRIFGLSVGGPSFHVTKHELECHYAPKLIEASRLLGLRPPGGEGIT